MKFIFGLAIFTSLALLWSLWGRDWLKAKGWGWSNAFFAWLEPIEAVLWRNSKTIFIARLKVLNGLLLTAFTNLGAINIEPIMPIVPEGWEPTVRIAWNMVPLILSLLGWMDEHLRNHTTEPIVKTSLTEAEKQQPEVAAAVAKFEEAKAEVAAVAETVKAQEAA
jgi:hypothetical protein